MADPHRSRQGRPRRSRDTGSDQMLRNGYLLALTAMVTAVLGVAYWAIAARLSSPEEVGQSAAVITALTLIANLAGFNLRGSFGYLVPRLGPGARRLVMRCYVLTTGVATTLGLVLLSTVTAGGWPSLGFLLEDPLLLVLLPVAAPLFVLFVIQDGVLIASRRARWVLVENLVFALGKLLALVVLLAVGVRHGIAYSWIGATAVIVPAITLVIFARVLPAGAPEDRGDRPAAVEVRRFVGLMYVGALVGELMMGLLPLVVLGVLGPEASGLFYVPWTIAVTVDLVSHSMGASLTVESALDPSRLGRHLRSVVRRLAVLLGAGGLVGLLVAPLVLRVYGPEYAGEAVLLLRLLILGAVLRAVVVITQSAARARGRSSLILLTNTVTCVLVLGLSGALLPTLGIEAAGWAWLAGNAVVAAGCLPSLVSMARVPAGAGIRTHPDPAPAAAAEAVRREP